MSNSLAKGPDILGFVGPKPHRQVTICMAHSMVVCSEDFHRAVRGSTTCNGWLIQGSAC